MKLIFLTVCALLAVAVQGDETTNKFLDQILVNARPEIQKIDPLRLPEARHGFSKKIVFVTVKGEASVYDGYVSGLSTIHRSGEANMRTEGQNLIVTAHAGLSNLRGQYRAHATFMNLGPHVSAKLGISSVSVRLGLKQSMTPGAHPDLFDFHIEHIGGISVHIGGLGPLGWIVGGLTSFIANILKGVIANAINAPIRNAIRNELSKVTIPF